jgi:hypothetical protein
VSERTWAPVHVARLRALASSFCFSLPVPPNQDVKTWTMPMLSLSLQLHKRYLILGHRCSAAILMLRDEVLIAHCALRPQPRRTTPHVLGSLWLPSNPRARSGMGVVHNVSETCISDHHSTPRDYGRASHRAGSFSPTTSAGGATPSRVVEDRVNAGI